MADSTRLSRFMAELRPLLERHNALLDPPRGRGDSWAAEVVFADDPQGRYWHIYEEDGRYRCGCGAGTVPFRMGEEVERGTEPSEPERDTDPQLELLKREAPCPSLE